MYIVSIFLFSIATAFIAVFAKFSLRRSKYIKIIPSRKSRFFNVLGGLTDMPLKEKNQLGISFSAWFLQVLSGYAAIFQERSLFCFWVSFVPFVVLTKADVVEQLLMGTKMMGKSWSYRFLHEWLGTGLLTSSGPKWKSRRKLLTPSFHFEILKDFLPIFNEHSRKFVQILHQETDKEYTDVVMPVTLCSLDIICETTLGVNIRAQENSDSEYIKSVTKISDIIFERTFNCFYWSDFLFGFTEKGKEYKRHLTLLHNFTNSVIHEKKSKLLCGVVEESNKKKRKALMDTLLEHHVNTKSLTENDIREEVDTFAFEGHDTTSYGVSWALYLIGLHEDVQSKVHEELDRIFGDDTERDITTDDLSDMHYLECVLKESQRLHPSVPFIGREVTEDFELCGYRIPKGASCVVFTYILHRDKNVFPNPEKFDPDRFLPENSTGRHPFAYIPFSAGPRNCIGQRFAMMEEKVIVSSVLRHFRIKSLQNRDEIIPVPELILRPGNGLKIQFRPRSTIASER